MLGEIIIYWTMSQILLKVLNLLLSGSVQNFLDGWECGESCCVLAQVAVCHEVSN